VSNKPNLNAMKKSNMNNSHPDRVTGCALCNKREETIKILKEILKKYEEMIVMRNEEIQAQELEIKRLKSIISPEPVKGNGRIIYFKARTAKTI